MGLYSSIELQPCGIPGDLSLGRPEVAVGDEDAGAEEVGEGDVEAGAFDVVGEVEFEEVGHVGGICGCDAATGEEWATDEDGVGGGCGEEVSGPIIETVAVLEEGYGVSNDGVGERRWSVGSWRGRTEAVEEEEEEE
ncbi:hypothetical protein MRB53_009582 [Persea americana]|uniref:Uncharacterized protein n=1 Tax=Persea americana TaxID=3435 RepID=A0ACC2LPS8_PERAE|nr:hypothetical protein MRB53_009582 [Persea americana]